jgi:hypothetical protein
MIPFDGLSDIRAQRRRCIDAATNGLADGKIASDSGEKRKARRAAGIFSQRSIGFIPLPPAVRNRRPRPTTCPYDPKPASGSSFS